MQKLVFTIVILVSILIPIAFFVNYIANKTRKILDLKLSDMTGMNIVYIIFYCIVNYYLVFLWLICLVVFLNVMGVSYFYDLIVSA